MQIRHYSLGVSNHDLCLLIMIYNDLLPNDHMERVDAVENNLTREF